MSQHCKAVVFREVGKPLAVEQVTIAAPRRHEVMVKIAALGICHTDFSVMTESLPIPPPMVLGHEAAGVIVQVGEDVKDCEIGDHVAISWAANCGKCSSCTVGKPQLCDETDKSHATLRDGTSPILDANGNAIGTFLGIGAMAEYATIARENVVKIDPSIPFEIAAIVGCAVMTGVGAVINTAQVTAGSTVAVFGIGGIGINVIQGAVLAGAQKIIAVTGSDSHMELARKFGATHVINTKVEAEPIAKVQEITNGGVDYAFECAGQPLLIAQAYESIRKGGTAVVVGLTNMNDTVTIPSASFMLAEKTLTGSNYGSARPNVDFPRLLGLYQRGLLNLDEMITHRYKMEEVNQAFADMVAGKNIRGLVVL